MTESKGSKRKSKIFPGKSSVQKNAKIKENTVKNDEKFEINSQKIVEEQLNIENGNEKKKEGEELLGKLLSFLRSEKKMSSLMVCREIKKIEIIQNVAEIDVSENQSKLTEKVLDEIKPFFNSFGLSIKIKEQEKYNEEVEKLNELLGGRLQIKH